MDLLSQVDLVLIDPSTGMSYLRNQKYRATFINFQQLQT